MFLGCAYPYENTLEFLRVAWSAMQFSMSKINPFWFDLKHVNFI